MIGQIFATTAILSVLGYLSTSDESLEKLFGFGYYSSIAGFMVWLVWQI